MNTIFEKIKRVFSDCFSMNKPENESLYDGYNLPPFVKDYINRGFSDPDGDSRGDAAVPDADGVAGAVDAWSCGRGNRP